MILNSTRQEKCRCGRVQSKEEFTARQDRAGVEEYRTRNNVGENKTRYNSSGRVLGRLDQGRAGRGR